MLKNEDFIIVNQEYEEFEIINTTYFSEPFWGKVVNKT